MAIVGNTKLPFPVGTDPQSVRQRVEAMERLLEACSSSLASTGRSGWT